MLWSFVPKSSIPADPRHHIVWRSKDAGLVEGTAGASPMGIACAYRSLWFLTQGKVGYMVVILTITGKFILINVSIIIIGYNQVKLYYMVVFMWLIMSITLLGWFWKTVFITRGQHLLTKPKMQGWGVTGYAKKMTLMDWCKNLKFGRKMMKKKHIPSGHDSQFAVERSTIFNR